MLLLSDELMRCCAAGTNGCHDLRCHASALDGQVSADWSRCPGSVARRSRDSVAPFDEAQHVGSSNNSQGVVGGGVDEVGMSTAAPDRRTIRCG